MGIPWFMVSQVKANSSHSCIWLLHEKSFRKVSLNPKHFHLMKRSRPKKQNKENLRCIEWVCEGITTFPLVYIRSICNQTASRGLSFGKFTQKESSQVTFGTFIRTWWKKSVILLLCIGGWCYQMRLVHLFYLQWKKSNITCFLTRGRKSTFYWSTKSSWHIKVMIIC